jgi:hypothetical protein
MRYPQFLTGGRSPPPARSILKSNNLEHAEQLQQLKSLMERFGATKTELATGNLLKDMVGTWGLEPQTSTVSIYTSITYNPLVLLLFRFQKPEKQP